MNIVQAVEKIRGERGVRSANRAEIVSGNRRTRLRQPYDRSREGALSDREDLYAGFEEMDRAIRGGSKNKKGCGV
jgi:hypothetical protein